MTDLMRLHTQEAKISCVAEHTLTEVEKLEHAEGAKEPLRSCAKRIHPEGLAPLIRMTPSCLPLELVQSH